MVAEKYCSVVIPVFNSEACLQDTVEQTVEFFDKASISYEIILINDGSSDNVWKVIRNLCSNNENIIGINLLKNYGQHSAILRGCKHAKGKYVVTMDDDLQNPPSEIKHLINEIEKGYDLVFGQFREKKHNVVRRCGTRLIDWLNHRIFDKPRDIVLTNFRIMNQSVVRHVIKFKGPYPYIPGLLLYSAKRVSNVSVEHQSRLFGKSNYNIKRILALMGRLLFNYSSFPLKGVCLIGFFASFLSFALGVFYMLKWSIEGSSVKGWTTLIVLMSFFFGVLILAIGIIGEYLMRLINQFSNTRTVKEKECLNDERMS